MPTLSTKIEGPYNGLHWAILEVVPKTYENSFRDPDPLNQDHNFRYTSYLCERTWKREVGQLYQAQLMGSKTLWYAMKVIPAKIKIEVDVDE